MSRGGVPYLPGEGGLKAGMRRAFCSFNTSILCEKLDKSGTRTDARAEKEPDPGLPVSVGGAPPWGGFKGDGEAELNLHVSGTPLSRCLLLCDGRIHIGSHVR